MIPRKRSRLRMNVRQSDVIRCPGHLIYVRSLVCAIKDRALVGAGGMTHICSPRIEAAHVRTGTDGGTGMKPGDNWTLPLCDDAHRQQHQIGEPAFERAYNIDMKKLATALWNISPAAHRYRAKLRDGK